MSFYTNGERKNKINKFNSLSIHVASNIRQLCITYIHKKYYNATLCATDSHKRNSTVPINKVINNMKSDATNMLY